MASEDRTRNFLVNQNKLSLEINFSNTVREILEFYLCNDDVVVNNGKKVEFFL